MDRRGGSVCYRRVDSGDMEAMVMHLDGTWNDLWRMGLCCGAVIVVFTGIYLWIRRRG